MKKTIRILLLITFLTVGCSQAVTETAAPPEPEIPPTVEQPTPVPPSPTTAESAAHEAVIENWKPVLAIQMEVSSRCTLLIDLISEAVEAGEVSSELFSKVLALQEQAFELQQRIDQMDPNKVGGKFKERLSSYAVILNDVIAQWMNDEINLGYAPQYLEGECGSLPELLDDMRTELKSEGLDNKSIDELLDALENE